MHKLIRHVFKYKLSAADLVMDKFHNVGLQDYLGAWVPIILDKWWCICIEYTWNRQVI